MLHKLVGDEVMEQVDRDYELTILRLAIGMDLDKSIAFTEEGLKSLESNRDRFVWQLATKIYSQSGHRVEFYLVRDVVNSWIGNKKVQLAEVRWAAEEKARQSAAEENRRIAEENRRIAEREARLAAEEKARICARTRLLEEIDKFAEQIADEKRDGNEVAHILKHLGKSKAGIFFKLQKVIIEQLSVEENLVNLDSDIRGDLGADSLDAVELIMAIEEEFDIEIPDEAAYEITTVEQAVDCIYCKL